MSDSQQRMTLATVALGLLFAVLKKNETLSPADQALIMTSIQSDAFAILVGHDNIESLVSIFGSCSNFIDRPGSDPAAAPGH